MREREPVVGRTESTEFDEALDVVLAQIPYLVRQASGTNELETDWFRANYIDGHHLPLRRPGRPEEVAGVAFFLAGQDATYITGQVITVDGGLTTTF